MDTPSPLSLLPFLPRRGRKPDDEDPETKRQKFLERNRAAASRCRARKKHWVDTLDKKAKELEMLNTSLQQEVILLRAEVQQLKSILLAHKDCPLMAKPGTCTYIHMYMLYLSMHLGH